MKCTKCGSEIQDNASFCTFCGMPVMKNNQNNEMNIQSQNTNNMINNTPKKSNPWPMIIITIVVAIIIVAIFAGIIIYKNDSDKTVPIENTQEKTEETPKEEVETKTVDFLDYKFTIPSNYTVSNSSSELLLTDMGSGLAAAIIYEDSVTYDTLVTLKDQIISILEDVEANSSESYDFSNAYTEEKTYNGTRFLITSGITQESLVLDLTYAETDNGVFLVSIAKANADITDDERDEIYSAVASANNDTF